EAQRAGVLRPDAEAQSDRADGDAGGDRRGDGVPGQPALQLHDRRQHDRRRRDHPARELLATWRWIITTTKSPWAVRRRPSARSATTSARGWATIWWRCSPPRSAMPPIRRWC